jgi:virulence factor Mce-like protein
MSTRVTKRELSRPARALLGLVAIVLFLAALGGTWLFLKGGFQSGTRVAAIFSDEGVGQQLPEGGDVKTRGVLVGRIDTISLESDGSVRVDMLLNEDGLDLPATTSARIGSKTLFGEKWVELVPQDEPANDRLAAGDVIPDSRTEEPLELETQLQLGSDLLSSIPLSDLATLLDTLAKGFGGSEKEARDALDDGLIALRAINDRSSELDLSLSQLREFSQWVDENDDELLTFMGSVDSANRALVAATPEFRASMGSVPAFLNDLAAFQEGVDQNLGRLVESGATVAEIVAERNDSLIDLVVQLEAFLTVWNSGLRQPCAGLYDSDLTCWQIYVAPGKNSRGLYGPNARPPNDNERGDPGNGRIGVPINRTSVQDFEELLRRSSGQEVPSDLAEILYGPTLADPTSASESP